VEVVVLPAVMQVYLPRRVVLAEVVVVVEVALDRPVLPEQPVKEIQVETVKPEDKTMQAQVVAVLVIQAATELR
jgi:hypothetical protein